MRATIKTFDLLDLFKKFISDSKSGMRLQPNGKKISAGTLDNYINCHRILQNYCLAKDITLCIRNVNKFSLRERRSSNLYWKKFYLSFTKWMYEENGYFDNYAGTIIKIIKSFFSYLNKDLSLDVGDYYKQFYVWNETISIFPLQPEELNFLIYDLRFEATLTARMKEVKDFFVFGCTVALRFSDLIALKPSNLFTSGGSTYLTVRSIKTRKETLVKLPSYAIAILNKRDKRKSKLLPKFNITNINELIKRLLELAGCTQPVIVTRSRRGVPVEQIANGARRQLRFCDVVTSHTMRRTAITTMLRLGMTEQVVRQISGHASGSKEFFKYVVWSQAYQDQQTESVFERLEKMKLQRT